eukprot:TRINITY_DN65116_c0_g2_i1.p1 TRINITY_DN65116_c0_g2~~TRINITY_DN65116_c0_g2_i1.p1  ORF type:complete len:238 (+),score=25.01 TRINITY_DN65116_c0_g2_i1:97-810(+)
MKKTEGPKNIGKIADKFPCKPNPEFIQSRLKKFEILQEKHQVWLASQPQLPIKIKLMDGKIIEGISNKTSPLDIARKISLFLVKKVVVAKINYALPNSSSMLCDPEEDCEISPYEDLWDLRRPLIGDCELRFLSFDDSEGRDVFWHSSAHILGQVIERVYGGLLCHGPAREGFFYDAYLGEQVISSENYSLIEAEAKKVIKEAQEFVRIVIDKNEALDLFSYNPFKIFLINSPCTLR